ncbi:MAG: cupin domain-containing protein [Patescibacteria group bacterium]
MNEQEIIKGLIDEGYSDVQGVDIPANFDSGVHVHEDRTVHVIVSGELTITDDNGIHVYHEGDRVEFDPDTKHTARGALSAGRMIVGVRRF